MDGAQATKLANRLGAAFPGRNLQAVNIRAWANEFSALDFNTATEVAGKLAARCTDPPSIAQIRQCVNEVKQTTASPPVLTGRPEEGITFGEWLRRNPDQEETARRVFPSFFKQTSDGETLPADDVVRRDLA